MEYIVNAAPMLINRGTRDASTVNVAREPLQRPTHCPKIFIYAQKGLTGPVFLNAAERELMYGSETFNLRSKFANHATVFANGINTYGNTAMYERVVPTDAGPESNITIWIDVLPTKVDVYERNIDGSIKLNTLGSPIVTGVTDGFKVKFIATHLATKVAAQDYGRQVIAPGNQTDAATSTQSQRYPLFSFRVPSVGSYGNNTGFRAWAATTEGGKSIPAKMMATERAYPFYFSFINRADLRSSPVVTDSIYGEQAVMVTFKKDTVDPLTEADLYIGDKLLSQYNNNSDPRYSPVIGDFNSLVVYENNLATLLGLFHAAEVPHINTFSDFSSSTEDTYLFNFLSGTTSDGVPYTSYQFVDDVDSVRLTEFTNIFASGGSDGTMSDELFAELVSVKVAQYMDLNSDVQDLARHVESVIYDSGFPLATKYELIKFISQRKDTNVVLSPYEVGQPTMSAAEEHSAAIALRTRVQNYPDSSYYGTPAFRATIIGRSGKIRNSLYTKRLPLTYELAVKSARYMGAGNGVWNHEYSFSRSPLNEVEFMYDINITWVPGSERNRNWDVGLNFVLAKDTRSFFFPAFKTAYTDDTSVLNSYITMCGVCELHKAAFVTWTELTGADDLTDAQICEKADQSILTQVQGKFDSRFVITPKSTITNRDAKLGFVWSTKIGMQAPNMKTVMVAHVEAARLTTAKA